MRFKTCDLRSEQTFKSHALTASSTRGVSESYELFHKPFFHTYLHFSFIFLFESSPPNRRFLLLRHLGCWFHDSWVFRFMWTHGAVFWWSWWQGRREERSRRGSCPLQFLTNIISSLSMYIISQ